jgi:hypothetical protein
MHNKKKTKGGFIELMAVIGATILAFTLNRMAWGDFYPPQIVSLCLGLLGLAFVAAMRRSKKK